MKKLFVPFVILVWVLALCAGSLFVYNNIEIAKLPSELRLKAPKQDILGISGAEPSQGVVQYEYLSKTLVPAERKDGAQEVMEKRTNDSRTWKIGKDKEGRDIYQTQIYGGDSFYKKGEYWYAIQYATTTNKAYAMQMGGLIEKAYAADFLATSWTRVVGSNITYTLARGLGNYNDSNLNIGQVYSAGPAYGVIRRFARFDTSTIGAGNAITAVTMTLTPISDNSATDFDVQIAKYNWSSYDPISSGNRDTVYDGCLAATLDDNIWRSTPGMSIYFPYTSGALSPAYVSTTASTYYCLLSSRDSGNTTPVGDEYITFADVGDATTAYRPYLNVTYTAIVAPTITTPTATEITDTGAMLGANITSNGGGTITAKGTCWGTSASPTTNCQADGATATGIFTQRRFGMPRGTLIYYRGYATNAAGTSYSADGTFTTTGNAPVWKTVLRGKVVLRKVLLR